MEFTIEVLESFKAQWDKAAYTLGGATVVSVFSDAVTIGNAVAIAGTAWSFAAVIDLFKNTPDFY